MMQHIIWDYMTLDLLLALQAIVRPPFPLKNPVPRKKMFALAEAMIMYQMKYMS